MTELDKLLDLFDEMQIQHIHVSLGEEPMSQEDLAKSIRLSIEDVRAGRAEEVNLSI